ncbi:MAG TPA: hypothetical protein VGF85_00910 [Opitutaceae bacterium]
MARLAARPPRVLVLAACAAILCLRRAEALTHPQFWAEDAYFFQRAYVLGWSSLVESYAGYLHTILRLISEAAVRIDASRGPALFVAAAFLLTLYVASRALSERCPLPCLGGAFALAIVLVPSTYEVLLTVVNLQWVLAAGLILLLLSRDPSGAGQWTHDLVSAALLGLTGPYAVILAPLFAWRAFRRRSRASLTLALIIAACAAAHLYFFRTEPELPVPPQDRQVAASLILPAIGHRVGASIALGVLEPRNPGLAPGTVLGLATLAGVAFLAFRAGPRREERALLGVAFGGLLFGALLRTRYSLGVYFEPLGDGRYVYLPQLIALWLLLLAAADRGRIGRFAAVLLVLALAVNLPRLREPAYADLHWERYAPLIRAGERVVVPTNPPGWFMPLPARQR